MPTARELLEQADALMRRNRPLAQSTSRPVTPPPSDARATLAPPPPVASPRPIQREPIASSVVHTSLPIQDVDAGEFAEPLLAPQRAPAIDAGADERDVTPPHLETADEDDFPVLTETVDEPVARFEGADDDDLPLLTDAVTEIGSAGVDEAARGEPSLWELSSRGEASVLGPAPDSVIVVPPADVVPPVPQAPPRGRDPLGLDQPAPGFAGQAFKQESAVTNDGQTRETAGESGIEPFVEEPSGDGSAASLPRLDEVRASYDEEEDAPHVFSAAVSHMPPEDAEEAAVGAGDPPAMVSEAPGLAEPAFASSEAIIPEDVQLANDTPVADVEEHRFAASAPADARALAKELPAATALDQQRIREIAEEIGMQVLQRIDIFTDTTLRAKLGERLRPVVDRAAADLVTAINEHVGELLRAQVAEAIEREIESWRNR